MISPANAVQQRAQDRIPGLACKVRAYQCSVLLDRHLGTEDTPSPAGSAASSRKATYSAWYPHGSPLNFGKNAVVYYVVLILSSAIKETVWKRFSTARSPNLEGPIGHGGRSRALVEGLPLCTPCCQTAS